MNPNTPNNPYPEPDPSWYYYQTWAEVCAAHAKLEQLMQYMSSAECEDATPQSDRIIEHLLTELQVTISKTITTISSSPQGSSSQGMP